MPRPDKVSAVESIQTLFEGSSSFFVTDYQGLNVADITSLRKSLRDNQIRYLVAKNTLFKLAAHNAGVTELDKHFAGPTAVAFTSEDPSVAAKILHDSFKEKDLPKIKVFVLDKDIFAGDDIKRLADLPSREVLLSQLVAAVESPMTSLVGSLDAVFRDLVGSIDALSEKRKTEG
jgi:large subunit ribosomal protein L10